MILRGINFGPVLGASGVQGFFGDKELGIQVEEDLANKIKASRAAYPISLNITDAIKAKVGHGSKARLSAAFEAEFAKVEIKDNKGNITYNPKTDTLIVDVRGSNLES